MRFSDGRAAVFALTTFLGAAMSSTAATDPCPITQRFTLETVAWWDANQTQPVTLARTREEGESLMAAERKPQEFGFDRRSNAIFDADEPTMKSQPFQFGVPLRLGSTMHKARSGGLTISAPDENCNRYVVKMGQEDQGVDGWIVDSFLWNPDFIGPELVYLGPKSAATHALRLVMDEGELEDLGLLEGTPQVPLEL